jgi:hypothetical protein
MYVIQDVNSAAYLLGSAVAFHAVLVQDLECPNCESLGILLAPDFGRSQDGKN